MVGDGDCDVTADDSGRLDDAVDGRPFTGVTRPERFELLERYRPAEPTRRLL